MLDNSQRTITNIQINYILMPDFILLFIKLGTWQQSFSVASVGSEISHYCLSGTQKVRKGCCQLTHYNEMHALPSTRDRLQKVFRAIRQILLENVSSLRYPTKEYDLGPLCCHTFVTMIGFVFKLKSMFLQSDKVSPSIQHRSFKHL